MMTTRVVPAPAVTMRVASMPLLALAGVAIAVVAALIPAGWAARARTALALRAE
jgi:putative ABC transport system permease protein